MGTYKKSLLLLTNVSEDVITKSKATELFSHNKTYIVHQNKRNSRKPLSADTSKQRTLDVGPKLSVVWRFHYRIINNFE